MKRNKEEVDLLIDALHCIEGAKIKIDGPTSGGDYFIDLVKYTDRPRRVCVQVLNVGWGPLTASIYENIDFGFSLIDEDTGYGDRPDCICNHIPTLVKYVSKLLEK